MALFLARAIMVILGVTYTMLGIWMTGKGIAYELSKRTFGPVLVFVHGEPPRRVDDDGLDSVIECDYIPFTIAGIMTLIIGICFLCGVP